MRQFSLFLLMVLVATSLFSQNQNPDSVLQKYDRFWEMQPGLYRVMESGQIGVVQKDGRVVVPCRFDQVWTPNKDNYIRVLLNMKTGLYHLQKGIILPAEYDQIWEFEDGLAKVMKDRKFGFVNKDGLMVVPCEFQHVWAPRNGRIKVIKDGLTGFFATNGQIIVPPIYQDIQAFQNNRARVIRDGNMGFIDEQGNEVIPAIYDDVLPFDGDTTVVITDGEYLTVDRQGQILGITHKPEKKYVDPEENEEEDKQNYRLRIEKDYIDIRHDGEGVNISRHRRNHRYFDGHLSGVGLALNGYLDSDLKEEMPDGYAFMSLNQTKSVEVIIYPWQESIRLLGSWFGLTTGIGLQYNNYRFQIENISEVEAPGNDWFPEIGAEASISKSKLMMMHVNIPVMAEIQIPNRRNHNDLFLSGGVVGGVRLQTHTKVVFDDGNGEEKKKKRGDMGMPTFRYGFMGQVGYGDFSVYATYYPEPMFKTGEGPELYPFSVGIKFHFD
ncbi:WG repeat-containing protein [Marinilabilia sp.]|uniref:WG repeat-containing protein n=1 Tax=Marinilabilia sp. TaxID=2021252 RepID=UPI0025B7C343|nr:WG repeat-containing protein [Marinilabilia sp.]